MTDRSEVEEIARKLLDLATQMGGVEKGLTSEGGRVVLSHDPDRHEDESWVVGIEFGKEAPDSPMAGGAAYGTGGTMLEALQQAVDETGWLRNG